MLISRSASKATYYLLKAAQHQGSPGQEGPFFLILKTIFRDRLSSTDLQVQAHQLWSHPNSPEIKAKREPRSTKYQVPQVNNPMEMVLSPPDTTGRTH